MRHRSSARLVVPLLAAAAAGCARDAVTEPSVVRDAASVPALTIAPEAAAQLAAALDDATARVLPSVDPDASSALTGAFRALRDAMARRDAAGVAAALRLAERSLGALRRPDAAPDGASADADALALVLARANDALHPASEAAVAPSIAP